MRNKKMLKVVSLIALATTCIVSGAFAFNTKVSNAETEDVFHELGASVRISMDKGIRFAFGLPENKTGDGYEIGTLMIPKEILDGQVLNHNEDESDEVDVDYQEVCCSKTWVPNETLEGARDGYKYYNAVLTEIPNWHYNTVVVARSYYKKDGVYTYSEPVERSIGYVASAALNYGKESEASNQILTDIVIAGYGETALSVDMASDLITVDEEATLIANNEKGYLPIWSSSNEAVATVDRTGKITAVRGGETTVTATIGNVSAEKKVYVLGDGLYRDQIGMRIGGYQYHDKPAYFNMATGENGEMIITAQFSDSAAYYPMLMLRNMYSKAYYQTLVSNGYTKLAFNLAVEGDISDLYVFGKALNTFPENEGVYAIVIDVEHITTYYDNIYGIATSGGQAGQAGSLDKMFIAWKSPLKWSGSRNYVFTISNPEFRVPTLDMDFAADSKEIIAVAETTTLVAAANVNGDIVWNSSNNEVATVENGVVTGVKGGEVTITATLGDLTAEKTVYVVGNTLDTDSFAVIAGAWNQPTYITTTTGENDEMVITAQFKGDQWRWPAVVLRNLESKAYYEKLIAEGYTKFVFNLAIGGANAADVSDLYIFGQLLSSFPVEDGVYTITVDVQNIVNNYDTIGILGTSVEAVPSKYHAQMLISWKCTASNASTMRNYVFTISNAAYVPEVTLEVTADKTEIAYGETATLTATTNRPESEIVWSTSDASIATVENGVVTVTGENWGEVTITATVEDVSVDTIITVNAPTQLEVEFAVESKDIITVNETTTLEATTDWNVERVVWSSSNNEVATVENGVVTGVKGGEVTITATLGDLTASKTVYVVGDGLYSDQIGARINGWNQSSVAAYCGIQVGENGEIIVSSKFQANATYSPALILRNMHSKAYYEKLIANGYTKLAFNLAVEGDVTDLYVFGKLASTFPVKDGVYSFVIDVQHIVNHYDTMKTIATSGNQVGQASSLAAKLISWKSPANDWSTVRDYVFTISNAAFMPEITLDVVADKTEIAYGETATLTATTNWDESFVEWSTSDATIATVENGVVTVTGENWGEVTITATVDDVSVDTIITVNAPTQLEVEFTAESKDIIKINGTTTLDATTDWNVDRVVWSSSNNEVATVENGVVTGLKAGEATITATLGDLTVSKTVYVVGDGLYSDQIGMRIGGYQYHDKPAYFNMATGENGEMIITAQFSDSAAYYPMLMLRNMYSKAYYQALLSNGYTKLAFNLAVEGDISDLYVFGKALNTFPENEGIYAIAIDVEHIVTYYDNIYGIATTGGQAGQAGSLDKMFIAWKSPLTWAGSRNYVFTISNAMFMSTPTLDVSADDDEIAYGETATLIATTDWDESFVKWSTSDATIATVENGLVTVTGENWGEVTITATIAGVSFDTIITVNAPTQLEVEFTAESKDIITINGTTTLDATTDWNVDRVVWSSSNNEVATVENGVVTGLKAGEATITATLGDLTASKTVYVVGDGLYSDQIGMRIGGYQYHDKPAYFNMATGENGEMIITAQFSDSAAYYPMLMLRNMYSKAYYQALLSNGYTKLAFNLAVEGDISDLYVFGKALNTFPENEGIYAIAIDVEHITTYYDNIYGIATTGGQAGQAGSLDKMFIAWKSPLTWAGSRNYVFTISNAAFMSTPTLDVYADDDEIAYGETATLIATTDWDESFVKWSSSDETIATVENGVVTVTGENWGEVTITATIAGVSVDTIITVTAPTHLEVEFAVESKDIITVNGTTTLEATADWNVDRVVWSSSNNEVATVENGVVKGVKGGEVTITATLGEWTVSKTVYVVGDGLYSDQIGMRIGGYQYQDKPAYFNMATGENGEMIITAQFSDSAAYYPMLMLRNMYSKAYYEKLLAEGYKKLTFSLGVGGDNAANVSDLYVFGKALPTFAKNANGAYQVVVDVQHIVTYYDNIYGIATTGGQAGQSGSLDKMLIAWKSPLTWAGSRNYVFTISNTGFRKGVLFSNDFGFRNGGVNKTYDGMTVDTGANGEIIIDATFNATATYGSFLMFNNMDTITYLGGLKGKYASFTFELTVEGGAVNDLHTFGTAKAISTCNKVSGKDNTYVVEIRLDMTYFTDSNWKANMNTFATSTGTAGSWNARSQMLIAWRYSGSSGFVNPGNHAPRNYKFTIANFELRESLLYTY